MYINPKLIDILSETLGIEKEAIQEKSNLIDELGVESIDFVDIIYEIEQAFDLTISEPEEIFPMFLNEYEKILDNNFNILPEIKLKLESDYGFINENRIKRMIEEQSAASIFEVGYLQDFINSRVQ